MWSASQFTILPDGIIHYMELRHLFEYIAILFIYLYYAAVIRGAS